MYQCYVCKAKTDHACNIGNDQSVMLCIECMLAMGIDPSNVYANNDTIAVYGMYLAYMPLLHGRE